jgi:hypothetical protein
MDKYVQQTQNIVKIKLMASDENKALLTPLFKMLLILN